MLEDLKNFNLKYSYVKYIILISVCFALGFSIGYQNRKIVKEFITIEKSLEQEQKIKIAVEKAVLEERNKWEKLINEKDIIEEITIKKPDGTSISKKKIDKTKTSKEKKVEEKIVEKVVEKIIYEDKIKIEEKIIEKKITIEPVKPNYSIGLGIDYSIPKDLKDLSNFDWTQPNISLEFETRVWTDFWIGPEIAFKIDSFIPKYLGLNFRYEF